MPSLTLTRANIDKLAAFLTQHSLKQFFIAKDDGAYVGASIGEAQNCIFYFKGCDPKKDKDYYDKAHSLFGGDDFGEHLDARPVLAAAADSSVTSLKVNITKTTITVEAFR